MIKIGDLFFWDEVQLILILEIEIEVILFEVLAIDIQI